MNSLFNITEETSPEQGATTTTSGLVVKEKKHLCKICGRGFTTKGNRNKHENKGKCGAAETELNQQFNSVVEDEPTAQPEPQVNQQQEAMETAMYQQELLALFLNNPTIKLDKPINLDYIQLINTMSLQELKMRCLEIKQNLSTKLDRTFSDTLIKSCSFLVGKMLGISEELEEVNSKDELLGQSCQELLSFRLGLFALPAEYKVSGLFVVNTVNTKLAVMKREVKKAKLLAEVQLQQQAQQQRAQKAKATTTQPTKPKAGLTINKDNDDEKNDEEEYSPFG